LLLRDYDLNQRRSTRRILGALRHLRAASAGLPLDVLDERRLQGYVDARHEAGAANATINRELAALRRSFTLARRDGIVSMCPHVAVLVENNVRTGFCEPPELGSVVAFLREPVSSVVTAAYVTGWRVRSEILTRQWSHVDMSAGWLRLEPGETKDRRGRMFPLVPALRQILETQRRRTDATESDLGTRVPWVFHRRGRRVCSFYRAWRSACSRAGVGHWLVHDLRRTAVRNLERAGVPRTTAMALVGHRTEAVYRRYAIVDERLLREGGDRLAACLARQ
jgi:integrase